jgi:hypothetical protein
MLNVPEKSVRLLQRHAEKGTEYPAQYFFGTYRQGRAPCSNMKEAESGVGLPGPCLHLYKTGVAYVDQRHINFK